MQFPTLSGIVSQPLRALTAADTETFTAQEACDATVGGMLIGGAVIEVRNRALIKQALGQPALDQVKKLKIGGLI